MRESSRVPVLHPHPLGCAERPPAPTAGQHPQEGLLPHRRREGQEPPDPLEVTLQHLYWLYSAVTDKTDFRGTTVTQPLYSSVITMALGEPRHHILVKSSRCRQPTPHLPVLSLKSALTQSLHAVPPC